MYSYYRHPRTTQELRAQQMGSDWEDEYGKIPLRLRRDNLPDTYDDIGIRRQKTWKKTRKTQYRQAGFRRPENRHELTIHRIEDGRPWWRQLEYRRFEDYLEAHKIPFVMEIITEPYYFRMWITHHIVRRTHAIAWKFVWWSDKDIGVEYIL